jgi:hypothetical protein
MSERNLAHYLHHLRLFRGIPDDIVEKVADEMKILEMQKGDVLVKAGDISNSLYIIRTGWVKITTAGHAGQEVMLNQCGPGQVIGEMSLIDQQNRSNTVIALCPTTVLEIDYPTVMGILNEYPAMAQTFLRDMSNRVRFANAYIGEAIEWCQQIAEGNYDFVKNQLDESQATIIDMNKSPQARAGAFLSAFFKMVEGIRQREEQYKRKIQELTIQIDEVKRQKSVEEITESKFFEDLQASAVALRARRQAKAEQREAE